MKEDESGKVRLVSTIQEGYKTNSLNLKGCDHFLEIQEVSPSAEGCEDCLKLGDQWVNLRLCLTCGYVGCCDASKNKHATKHYHSSTHPVIVSYQPDERWLWCYEDQKQITV